MASQRIFNLAATACGHNPRTTTGASDARHDRRVWDLVEQFEAEVDDEPVPA